MNSLIKNYKYLCVFIILGIIVYFPIFFNGFVWDDFPFIIDNPNLSINTFLGPNVFNSGSFYRPIPSLYFSILNGLFAHQVFFYHFFQLFLHIASAFLLFTFFLLFFTEGVAFFLGLLFLIHPIQVESVAFISSTTSELYFLFGMGAFLLGIKHNITAKRLVILSILLLLAVLTKEAGIIFLFAILLYRYLFKLDQLKRVLLSGISTGVIYLLLRIFVGGVTLAASSDIPIRELSLSERLINIPAIILYYLKTFVFPLHISIWQLWVVKILDLQNFYIPLLISLTLFFILLYLALVLRKHPEAGKKNEKRLKEFLFFTGWYVSGMILILQVIPLDMTVADRWFYFPIVGLLGLIGIGIRFLQSSYRINKIIFILAAVLFVSFFSIRTFVRAFDWKDPLTLYSHDVKEKPNQYLLLDQLALALYKEKKIEDALKYENMSVLINPTISNLGHLGFFYQEDKQYYQAILAYRSAISTYKSLPKDQTKYAPGMKPKADLQLEDIINQLIIVYHLVNQPHEIIKLINEEGLKKFPSSSKLYFYLALAEIDIGNYTDALKAITRSYNLSPNEENSYVYKHLNDKLHILEKQKGI